MRKLVFWVALPLLGFCVGCGPKATDTTDSDPAPTVESTQEDLEKAVEDGTIDEATYGQE